VSVLRACRRDRFALLDRPQPSLYNARRRANLRFAAGAQVAQLVEHVTENHGVGGSIPPLGTIDFSHLHQKSESELDSFSAELDTFVRRLVPSGSSVPTKPCILADVSAVSE
jgi:hypothetical protein